MQEVGRKVLGRCNTFAGIAVRSCHLGWRKLKEKGKERNCSLGGDC